MNNYRFKLEPYTGMNTRYRCPCCQHSNKTFSLYIDTNTGEHIHSTVGRCSRENNCGYHYPPKQYFQDNNISNDTNLPNASKPIHLTRTPKSISFIPAETFKSSLNIKAYETNNFVKFLIERFGVENVSKLVSRYFIATSKHWDGATVFWQIDAKCKVRTGKIMLYHPNSGKRIKEPFNHITWVHSALRQPKFELGQCLFGEHLLKEKTKTVAIVESEKTAIIASLYFPKFIWIATGGKENLNERMCSNLKGRNIILYPDINCFEHWRKKARELSNLGHITVSDLLERKANKKEREQGWDIADYLLHFYLTEFDSTKTEKIAAGQIRGNQIKPTETITVQNINKSNESTSSEFWGNNIAELLDFFETAEVPKEDIILKQGEIITNISAFIQSHIATIRTNKGKTSYRPYINRLYELKKQMENLKTNGNAVMI